MAIFRIKTTGKKMAFKTYSSLRLSKGVIFETDNWLYAPKPLSQTLHRTIGSIYREIERSCVYISASNHLS
jgi:hypothetical protein